MELGLLDISVFVLFFLVVVGTSMFKSRKEETGEDYFLASRGLIWPIIGISLNRSKHIIRTVCWNVRAKCG